MTAPRDDLVYLGHIRDAIAQIELYLRGVSRETFVETPMIQDAVIRQIQVIGEAAKRLSPEFTQARPDVPWKAMAGMRDKLVHDYFGIAVAVVWKTASEEIPSLKAKLDLGIERDGSA